MLEERKVLLFKAQTDFSSTMDRFKKENKMRIITNG